MLVEDVVPRICGDESISMIQAGHCVSVLVPGTGDHASHRILDTSTHAGSISTQPRIAPGHAPRRRIVAPCDTREASR